MTPTKPYDNTSDGGLFKEYAQLVEPHIASFNYFVREGLSCVVKKIKPIQVQHPVSKKIYNMSVSNASIGKPMHPLAKDGGLIYPRECREMRLSYTAPIEVHLSIDRYRVPTKMGYLPIMVRSDLCNLKGMSKKELYRRGEEANDFGGYFIAGGLDKLCRMLLKQKRHYIMALDRADYVKNGPHFTSKATVIRCVRDDEIGSLIRCHYLKNDTVAVGITVGFFRFFLPAGVLLRALSEANDHELFDHLTSTCPTTSGSSHAIFMAQQAEQCLTELTKYGLKTQHEAIEFLGSYYRSPLECAAEMTDYDVGMELLHEYIFPHLDSLQHKFHLLIAMMHKLYAFCNSRCCADNPDSMASQEAVLPGFVFMKCMREIFRHYLTMVRSLIIREWKKKPKNTDVEDFSVLNKILANRSVTDVGNKLLMMIKTGRFVFQHSRDISQDNGLCISAERVNFLRYLSHYRAIHKGSDFAQMRTTQPRKLLPDAWGFLCPVHTPDGLPCGLLLHLTAGCKITVKKPPEYADVFLHICKALARYGMVSIMSNLHPPPLSSYISVFLDGCVVGHISLSLARKAADRLRRSKAINYARENSVSVEQEEELDESEKRIPSDMEVGYVPHFEGGMYPGLFLFTLGGRFVREVRQIVNGRSELIGPLAQQHLGIRCSDGTKKETSKADYTHEEIHTKNMLSILAALTPFSEFNQSPRNMYQCQMAKQTMGTPCHDFQFRPEIKLYRLQSPQSPICRTQRYREYHLDEYPSGTNAVVAVISYTGYDMEDAMILNKSSVDRGFAHGCIYKTEQHFLMDDNPNQDKAFQADTRKDAPETRRQTKAKEQSANRLPRNITTWPASDDAKKLPVSVTGSHQDADRIDIDGLPYPGAIIHPGQSYCSSLNYETDTYRTFKLKGEESAVVDQVAVIGNNKTMLSSASVRLRINRTPVIGDKFASRAGQKGILSRMWSDVDFPYCSATGMRPDLIINPHAFPSRMTIGMLIESITSKSAALQGCFVDCSPFQRCDDPDAKDKVAVFGDQLEKAGFSRQGTETMTCGITGEEMECDIYIGLVYYQRLRHMVSDKYQCRATGPINAMTKQPVQGRKAGGGIRFGEMERDSVASHGAAYVLNDRLMNSSDLCTASICTRCHSLMSPLLEPHAMPAIEKRMFQRAGGVATAAAPGRLICPACDGSSDCIERVTLPYVAGVLIAELAATNISVKLRTTPSSI